MVLANLLATNKAYIETFEDLANAELMTTTLINTTHVVEISVNIIYDYNSRKYILFLLINFPYMTPLFS